MVDLLLGLFLSYVDWVLRKQHNMGALLCCLNLSKVVCWEYLGEHVLRL